MNKEDKESIEEKTASILLQQYVHLTDRYEESILEKLSAKKKSIYIIVSMLDSLDFHGHSTKVIYEAYYHLCQQNNVQNVFPKEEFSKFICKWFTYEVVDLKRKGKKHRVFKKVQDEG
ncbi:MAG: hypothetical protein FNP40_13995 [Dehalobacter sp. 4CP]|uniref:hypothetical protein n=1 Tax=Dehalobacter sp. CP TaxID=2594474 RepID=UPI0013C78563|nr:hypothetical protein [Dehalobacter sp. 4CP]